MMSTYDSVSPEILSRGGRLSKYDVLEESTAGDGLQADELDRMSATVEVLQLDCCRVE